MSAGPDRENRGNGKSLGTAACTAIVVGNMVGSGFYLSPAAVAPFGNLAIIAWIVMGVGAICLGLTFAKLARLAPATGGPYAYTRRAFGDFAGFLIAWGYWISIWVGLGALAAAFAGYLNPLFPALVGSPVGGGATAVAALWVLVGINIAGVRSAGWVQSVTTVLKIVPLVAVG